MANPVKMVRVSRAEEISAHYVATAASHLTQALHWHKFALGIGGDRRLSLARCVELYAREAGRCARCAGQPPETWHTRAAQAIGVHAIAEAFLAGWQECDVLLTSETSAPYTAAQVGEE